MRAILAMAFWALPALAQQPLTIAVVTDHGVCSPGRNSPANGSAGCSYEQAVATLVHSWNPDYVLTAGDISNSDGARAEVYRSVLAKLAAPITGGATAQTATISTATDGGTLNGSLYLFGSSAYAWAYPYTAANPKAGPYLPVSGTLLSVGEGAANWELVTLTAQPSDDTHFTAVFHKNHAAGELVRGSDHTPYLDYITAGKYLPVLGNHDGHAGSYDTCSSLSSLPCQPSLTDIVSSQEYWPDFFGNGNGYWIRQYNRLITIFAVWGYGNLQVGGDQEQFFTKAMKDCSTPWCITVVHQPPYGSYSGDRLSVTGPGQQWVAGPNVDLVISGHSHWYERYLALSSDGTRTLNYITVISGGDGNEPTFLDTQDLCGTPGAPGADCARQAFFNDKHGAARMTVTATSLHWEAFDTTGLLRDELTLTKPAGNPASLGGTAAMGGGAVMQ